MDNKSGNQVINAQRLRNCLGIPIIAIGRLAPWVAGAAMALSSVLY